MTTQSTGNIKGRIAGVLIVLIALPTLALAPAFLADRFAMQSPTSDGHASVQPSAPDIPSLPMDDVAETATDFTLQLDEDSTSMDLLRDSDEISIVVDGLELDDSVEEIVLLDSSSDDDDCIFTLHIEGGTTTST